MATITDRTGREMTLPAGMTFTQHDLDMIQALGETELNRLIYAKSGLTTNHRGEAYSRNDDPTQ